MKYLFPLYLLILSISNIFGQDLSNCDTQMVTLLDDQNGYSSSAMVTVNFESNCGCNAIENCQILSVEIPSNYTCQGLVIGLENTLDWYDDHFDLYYLPSCIYHGNDDWDQQKSNYIAAIDPIQTGGTFEILVCAGEDLPNGSNSVNINIRTSDLCYIEDCNDDNETPTCNGTNFTVELDPGQNYYTFDINDFASDECSPLLTYENASLDPTTPNGTITHFWSGYEDQFQCGTYIITSSFPFDDAGNFNECAFTFSVKCSEDTCENIALDFDGVNDRIESPTPLTGNSNYSISMDFKCGPQNNGPYNRLLGFTGFETEIAINGTDLAYYNGSSWRENVGLNVADNEWHNVTLTRGNNENILYLDGNVISVLPSPTLAFTGSMVIGHKANNGSNEYFKGQIDNLKIWNTTLDSNEVCKNITANDFPNVLYYDFEEGEGGQDNTSITGPIDLAGGDHNGTFYNFNLNGESSNFVCTSDFELLVYCTEECQAEQVLLNTGIDFADNSELAIGQYEGGWQLIDGPDEDLTYPRPGYVLNPNSVWSQLPGTQYISPFPRTANNQSFSDAYVFERCFCITQASSEVTLDVSAYVDNFINIGLYDSEGNLIQELIDYQGPPLSSTFTGDPFTSVTTHDLNTGTYCLRAGLRNDGNVSMGMAVQASVTGAGLIENGCCSPFTILTGTVYSDGQCNGIFDDSDESLQGQTVELCNASGETIMTSVTDVYGYYSFQELATGEYTVKLANNTGQTLSQGEGGYTVNLSANTVIGDLDYGICIPEYCTEECQAEEVLLNTGIDFADNSELAIGEYEGGWQLIDGPDEDLTYPRPGYVLNPNPVWAQLPGTQYISPFPRATNNQSFSEAYVFERCFCICEASSEVTLDVSAYVDNFINIGLYDSQGSLIQELIDYQGPPLSSTFTGDPFTSVTTHDLNTGTYCLRAGLRNDGNVSMGMAVQASVTGAGLIENGCCSPFTILTGTVYLDGQCNGIFDDSDESLQGQTVELCNASGETIMTTVTDVYGYYSFQELATGEYTVKLANNTGQTLSQGEGGYTVNLSANTVIGDLDFGNCNDPCISDTTPPTLECDNSIIVASLNEDGIFDFSEQIENFIDYKDDCSDVIISINQEIFTCENIGENEISVFVTDVSGNSSSCILIVIVEDKLPPFLTCSTEVTQLVLGEDGTAEINEFSSNLVTASDNCSEVSLTLEPIIFDCDDIGLVTVEVIGVDESGNQSRCTLQYQILDTNGSCEDCCATSSELTTTVQEEISVSSLICLDDDSVTLAEPDLLSCQSITRIFWGNGEVSEVDGDIPSYLYEVNGVYLITVEVTSQKTNGQLCQTDYIDLPILIKNCEEPNNINNLNYPAFKLYPIPTKSILNIELSINNGYSIEIMDVLGQVVLSSSIDAGQESEQLDISTLLAGNYFIRLISLDNSHMLEARFIKI